MPPWEYQILHPWHWLTYGQNAAALQAVCALLGVIGLLFYVIDTRRMRRISELTRRASITPVFTANEITPRYTQAVGFEGIFRIDVTIRNVGEGPATVFWAWYQPVSPKFSVFNSSVITRPKGAQYAHAANGDLLKGELTEVIFDAYNLANPSDKLGQVFPHGSKWLFVVDSTDQAQGRHQLQMLVTMTDFPDHPPTDVSMVHSLGDTFRVRVVKYVRGVVDFGLIVRGEISRRFK